MNWKDLLTSHLSHSQKPLIVLLGPTASGKTDLSLEVARFCIDIGHHPEILNADSRQLYRFLNIGTGKIRPEEMQGFSHHLLDVLDPKEEATAAWYQVEAERIIGEIHSRSGIPILVGGSMLYISSLIDGLNFVASSDPALRSMLSQTYDLDGGTSLHEELMAIDPMTARAFSPKNKPYVIRAMEIYRKLGKIPSSLKQSTPCPWDLLILGLQCPRSVLSQRIHARISSMFDAGWIEEVRGLLLRGYSINDPGMKSVGYREIAETIQSGQVVLQPRAGQEGSPSTSLPSTSLRASRASRAGRDQLIELIASKTRQYAKRQITWWRRDQRIHWMDLA